jgi:hypothetical protein
MEKNKRKVNFRGEKDWRQKILDGDEIPWVTKKFVGDGCRRWKMAEGVVFVVTRGLAR